MVLAFHAAFQVTRFRCAVKRARSRSSTGDQAIASLETGSKKRRGHTLRFAEEAPLLVAPPGRFGVVSRGGDGAGTLHAPDIGLHVPAVQNPAVIAVRYAMRRAGSEVAPIDPSQAASVQTTTPALPRPQRPPGRGLQVLRAASSPPRQGEFRVRSFRAGGAFSAPHTHQPASGGVSRAGSAGSEVPLPWLQPAPPALVSQWSGRESLGTGTPLLAAASQSGGLRCSPWSGLPATRAASATSAPWNTPGGGDGVGIRPLSAAGIMSGTPLPLTPALLREGGGGGGLHAPRPLAPPGHVPAMVAEEEDEGGEGGDVWPPAGTVMPLPVRSASAGSLHPC